METKEIIIIGGGIIGCTTAYYLSQHIQGPRTADELGPPAAGLKITLLEASAHGPAQGASGKAGGLVARWAYPKEIVNLSFDEHVQLAEKHGGAERWGWRYVNCGSWEGRGEALDLIELDTEAQDGAATGKSLEKTLGLPGGQKPAASPTKRRASGLPHDLDWVGEALTDSYTPMARSGDTAQVHPYLFTTSMFELAQARGVTHIHGRATTILQNKGRVTGVEYVDGTTGVTATISATHVVLAAGAWSPTIVPSLPIAATRAHSITIRPKDDIAIAPYVLFTEIRGPASASSPEIYARPDNEVYACGTGDDEPLPRTVDDVVVDPAACDVIYAQVASISRQLRAGTVEKHQACYLPSVSTGAGPIVGEARKIAKGLYIGTGHTCWGISNAPGSAKALTELIMDGKVTSANLKKLDPSVILL
ncbi:hypothetical protein HYPSUDRAFT_37773 [Hypholoma sublateritium FD-334 SS-4]|uniref:FAD dependent oxidoreductase domain-containing protein n=1 Tax=Hypholoma sublateritium (strain FD-334 SS-4) TaxID=945553 RepID=A0A0D2MMX2_HYPSF|nr:hypothetical protein HYPSUDRAFT_37773 [Hypholoma sublateritium FD-334 SS-4]